MKHQRNNRWVHELESARKIIKILQQRYYDFRYIEEEYYSSIYLKFKQGLSEVTV